MLKHFSIIEIGADSESPMVGTILNIPKNKQGYDSFKDRFVEALKEHFDTDEFNYDKIDLDRFFVDYSPYEDIMIEIDGYNYEVRIMETWTY